jgi:hypothetical protein
MKRPIFIMIILVAIAFAGPMLMTKPDGTPFMEAPWQSSDQANTSQSFYKWQGEDGTWHYSDQPMAGQNIETVTVNIYTNLIQGLRIEKKDNNETEKKPKQAKADIPSIPLPMTVPMDKVSEMLENANNMQQLMDERKKKIDQATQGR